MIQGISKICCVMKGREDTGRAEMAGAYFEIETLSRIGKWSRGIFDGLDPGMKIRGFL